jgi:hypothetical protein
MMWDDTGEMLDKYLRSTILNLAINLKDEAAIKKGRELFEQWKSDHNR